MALRKCTVLVSLLALFSAAAIRLPAQEKKSQPGDSLSRADSAAAAAKADSVLARADSSLVIKKSLSAGNYLSTREQFFYPETRRNDPFNIPFAKLGGGAMLGQNIDSLLLAGVIYCPEGRSVAIMEFPDGRTDLIHEGDILGLAEVILIEASRVTFRISEYGLVHTIIKELKPLVEQSAPPPQKTSVAEPQAETSESDQQKEPGKLPAILKGLKDLKERKPLAEVKDDKSP